MWREAQNNCSNQILIQQVSLWENSRLATGWIRIRIVFWPYDRIFTNKIVPILQVVSLTFTVPDTCWQRGWHALVDNPFGRPEHGWTERRVCQAVLAPQCGTKPKTFQISNAMMGAIKKNLAFRACNLRITSALSWSASASFQYGSWMVSAGEPNSNQQSHQKKIYIYTSLIEYFFDATKEIRATGSIYKAKIAPKMAQHGAWQLQMWIQHGPRCPKSTPNNPKLAQQRPQNAQT